MLGRQGDLPSPPRNARRNRTLDRPTQAVADRRARPRLWHHDYLHLRPLALDLERRIAEAVRDSRWTRVLDLGCGPSPYRSFFAAFDGEYIRLDLREEQRPEIVARAESIPLASESVDAVLATQILGLLDDPVGAGREIARVLRPGGRLWLSCPAAWPYDSARVEHRFGEPELPGLVPGLTVTEIVPQGGMLALPFAIGNQAVREAAIAAERRLGAAGRILHGPAAVAYTISNLAGRLLERMADRRGRSGILGYLDARLPMNFLVVAEKRW